MTRTVSRHAGPILIDLKSKLGRSGFAAPNRQRRRRAVRNTDVLTSEVIDIRREFNRFTWLRDGGIQRKDNFIFVTERFQLEDRKPFRCRPLDINLGNVLGSRPIGKGRETCISGRPPIKFPARLHTEMETGRNLF